MILLGIFSGVFSCGSGDLVSDHPKPAESDSPCGDAIAGSDQELVLLKRGENTFNTITCGSILAAWLYVDVHHFYRRLLGV
ncbi:hypothetical protein EV401DRAFT_1994286 [Pisolithus croceorrhizus]|nr:hypothetical protein EV401DRAFT_1994286 [Pisolithus croceorrhizus]